MSDSKKMQRTAQELRLKILEMNHHAGSGHTGGSFSCAEILTVLYDAVMDIRPQEPRWAQRDRFVLSKGHAAPALYATLARKGFFAESELMTLRQTGSLLQGHPCMYTTPGVDMSTGSLGMGLSVGLGMALSARYRRESWRVFVLCGDGELNEGQNWEAFMALAKWQPANLTAIIDRNHVQLDGTEDQIMPLGDVAAKVESFGLTAVHCDGHDCASVLHALGQAEACPGVAVLVAETVKGKGVSFMEGQAAWHGKPIIDEEYIAAKAELEAAL